jgi:hypothetical protein
MAEVTLVNPDPADLEVLEGRGVLGEPVAQ